ncbi:N-acetyltransferase family protein [Enterococcus durans]|nr:GNAT family N-acetyltransferase [Enterococcus durans]MBE8847945.1 N-acetyltransferase [Enterococcus durans]MBE9886410.1 N-acetyltransferase [Enterococcus durans]WCG26750.1 GNAT family N-acetyltransferase [Enterococcus durans]WCG68313.1 GNAT family N-acetyltransferase [Enterococcus durans]
MLNAIIVLKKFYLNMNGMIEAVTNFLNATIEQLPRIVEIYNQAIPGKMATADLKPITVESRIDWFEAHDPDHRPLWLIEEKGEVVGWISLSDFYGRPAYDQTVEISIYIDRSCQKLGLGQKALHFVESQLSRLKIETVLAFIFDINQASQRLFEKNGYGTWGHLPKIAHMEDRVIGLNILGKTYRS